MEETWNDKRLMAIGFFLFCGGMISNPNAGDSDLIIR